MRNTFQSYTCYIWYTRNQLNKLSSNKFESVKNIHRFGVLIMNVQCSLFMMIVKNMNG